MNDKIELLPCPFCGCSDIASSIDWGRGSYMSCNDCGTETGAFETDTDAIAAWNRRADIAQQPATADMVLRARIADLLHLLRFAKIETPSCGDAKQAEIAMIDLGRMLTAVPAAPVAFFWEDTDPRVEGRRSGPYFGWPTEEALARVADSAKPIPLYTATPAAEQSNTVAVPRELLKEAADEIAHMGRQWCDDDAMGLRTTPPRVSRLLDKLRALLD